LSKQKKWGEKWNKVMGSLSKILQNKASTDEMDFLISIIINMWLQVSNSI
jgi:hypothetical protein